MSSEEKPFPLEPLIEGHREIGASPWWRWGHLLSGRTLAWLILTLLLLIIPNSSSPLARQVRLVVNGVEQTIYTPQTTVIAVLAEAGLAVHSRDVLHPAPTAEVTSGQTITLNQARQATLFVDGQTHYLHTQARTIRELLREMGVILRPQDRVLVNGQLLSAQQMKGDSPLAMGGRQLTGHGSPSTGFSPPAPWHVTVMRAVPLYVADGGERSCILSAAATVGEALYEAGIPIRRGDQVEPSPDTSLSAGMQVTIRRAIPLTIQVDGDIIHTRTQGRTVADVLAQEGIALWGQDYVFPAELAALSPGMVIRVVRVREETITEQEAIPFETKWKPDAKLELDQRRVERVGRQGIIARRFRIRYEDGQEVSRTLEAEWRARKPEPKLIAYGTKIVSRQVNTPDGPRSYWRKLRVLVTSYSAATSGKPPGHPRYGITRLGWQMRQGIIAVDPRVINFGTHIYVPGYGVGVAADTGGKIRGRHIDLGYDDWNLKLWYKWMDIYLLDPPPPRSQIHWVLPNWPR